MNKAVNFLFPFLMPAQIFLALGMVLLFLMSFVPTTYQPIKGVLLAVLLCVLGIAKLRQNGGFRLHRSIAVWTLVIATTGAFFMLVGAANTAPGALRVGTVYLLWPVVFTILIGGLVSETSIHKLLAVLVYSGIALGLYGAVVFGHALGWLPDALYIEINQGQIVGLYKGFVEYNMYSIATLFFLVPFLYSAILHWERLDAPIVARRWLWLAYILCLALAILSGRRALWLVLLLTPVIHWGLSLSSAPAQDSGSATLRTSARLLLVFIAVFLLLKMIFGLELSVMAGRLSSSFGVPSVSAPEESALIRHGQAVALFSGWQESPWIGHGHGSVAQGPLRSTEFPWAYELSYLALLFHTGLLGTLLYAGCIAWIYWRGLAVAKHSSAYGHMIIPVLVGTTAFLLSNATNPYLAKFDFMWIVFLPLAIINRHLLESNSRGIGK